jgi:hypothetical protein
MKKVVITIVCLFLAVIIGGALYASYRINSFLSAPALQESLPDKPPEAAAKSGSPSASEDNATQPTNPAAHAIEKQDVSQPSAETSTVGDNKTNAVPENPTTADKEIANAVQQEIGSQVETADLLDAAMIIVKKLDRDEINFLFGFSDKTYTSEELKEVRSLLLSKLSAQDIKTLRALGAKYGKKLDILDPSVPIQGR